MPAAIAALHGRIWWAGVPALVLSMGFAGGVGWIAGRGLPRLRGRIVSLHTGGLVVAGPGGEAQYAWDELESVTVSGVRNAARERTRWSFTIVAEDGTVLRLGDDVPDVRELGEAVAAEVTARLVPRHLAAVKAGETVRMGPFALDRDGVEKDGERLPWHAVLDVEIDNGLVTVHSWTNRPDLVAVAAQTPDALAFVVLCHQVRDLTETS
ncbi:hypothetical protein BZB76_5719 [Actinomadura pelletieri DSM 43383]|uniref:Uncharacterized protein n=1 Tax=Actinomadura pelletieri DSM 43383 TaxID=1120940 RepID=A0A495QH42_9ACTN|nr:DUF6585 family protein [Actinomadura pelletieri]RKS71232.1 hypothetical protein BZB76_5719 [Actinomadura pelletieri DSM 43383]